MTSKITSKISKVKDIEVQIEAEIPVEDFERERKASIEALGANLELPGFRRGHIPENVLLERLGPMTVLEEMAERAIRRWYPEFLAEEKIDAVGHPQISITKIAQGSPLGFKIIQATLPIIKLPDYKEVAKEANKKLDAEEKPIEVTDEELAKIFEEIKKSQKNEGGEAKDLTDKEKENVKENLLNEKRLRVKDKRRIGIIEAILEKAPFGVPDVLVERQMDRFVDEIKDNLSRMNLKWEDYLKHAKKTEEEIRGGSRADAEKRVRTQLLLETIALTEKIEPDQEELERETKHILEHHKSADPQAARNYVAGIIRNTKVFELLENIR